LYSILLGSANLIADKALQKGRELKLAPLTVAVLGAGGLAPGCTNSRNRRKLLTH